MKLTCCAILCAVALTSSHILVANKHLELGEHYGSRDRVELIPDLREEVIEATSKRHKCETLHQSQDKCAAARSCESAGIVDYLSWFYCDMDGAYPFALMVLLLWTALLFSTIGIAASDFFCPNLATIANSLGMSESLAGITFLAFGNGSPDVFSTFAAFKAHSGSLAIGELLGAAAFITSVVAGSMAIIRPFKVSRRAFLRDAGFFLTAVIMTMFLLADGRLRLWESIAMIVAYFSYVSYSFLGSWYFERKSKGIIADQRIREQYTPLNQGEVTEPYTQNTQLLQGSSQTVYDFAPNESQQEDNVNIERELELGYGVLNRRMSLTGATSHPGGNSVRPSLLAALEFHSLVANLSAEGTISPSLLHSIRNRSRAQSIPVNNSLSHTLVSTNESNTKLHGTYSVEFDGQPQAKLSPNELNLITESEDHYFQARHKASLPLPTITGNEDRSESSPLATSTINMTASDSERLDNFLGSGDLCRIPTSIEELDSSRLYVQPESVSNAVVPSVGEILKTLFPSLCKFQSQSYLQKILSILAAPSVFVLTITLPVVDPAISLEAVNGTCDDRANGTCSFSNTSECTTRKPWNRWLTLVQCILAPAFLVGSFAYDDQDLRLPALLAIVCSIVLLGLLVCTTSATQRPKYHYLFCFLGFGVSVAWISTIANEVVGTLQAFGTILGLSDAILGLTVFAIGNSLGDFVADITVARQMALAAAFGGPMLNILLGIGISGIYINLSKHHVYTTEISPTLMVSAASLLTTLIVLLIAVPANDYVMGRKLGICLCAIFFIGMVASVIVELST